MLRCAKSPRSNVLPTYASARRYVARLASETFLSSLLDTSMRNGNLSEKSKLDSGSQKGFMSMSHEHEHVASLFG
jgi:hypothetical protein